MKPPKIVYLLKQGFSSLGGLEKATRKIAQGFLSAGCRVKLLCSHPVDLSDELPELEIIHLPTSRPGFLKIQEFDNQVQRYLSNKSFDVVFGMDRTRYQTHLRLGNGVHKEFLSIRKTIDPFFKRLVTPINPLHRLLLSIEKTSFEYENLRLLITNSHMVKGEVLKHYKVNPQKIEVIHNGVEWNQWQKDYDQWIEKKGKIALELGLNPSIYHFLFIGNGYQRKGLDVLLKAMALLKEPMHLSILGKDKNIPYYKGLAQKLGLSQKVSFFGQRPDIKKFYQLCDCLVIPSFYDPFANVTVEALAMGLFVISSKSNGGHEVLNTQNGITLSTLEDPDILKQALLSALSHPKTWIQSGLIRESVKHLDFSYQLHRLISASLTG